MFNPGNFALYGGSKGRDAPPPRHEFCATGDFTRSAIQGWSLCPQGLRPKKLTWMRWGCCALLYQQINSNGQTCVLNEHT